MRVALYSRVSSDEQAKHGISIEAQREALRKWAKDNGHNIVGEYVDPGISARKAPSKRPALQQLLADIPVRKIELVAFTKLDRWTRNVKGYYQVQDVLDRYKVAWIAVQEDYETITASGRFKVNIMLSVAENEADRTSERLKTVLAYKVEKGEAITRCQPFGYELRGKKVVQNEYAPAAREMFEQFAATGNTYAVRNMIQDKYGVRLNYESVYRFLQNPIYIGQYRDNLSYCEPLVSRELFEQVQKDFAERRKTKKAPTGRIYLFSGLLVCKECGRRMTATYNTSATQHPVYYRCPGHYMGKLCPQGKNVQEYQIEQALLQNIEFGRVELTPTKQKKTADKAAINKKLERLKELYIEGDITKKKYNIEKAKLNELLLERPQKDLSKFITKGFCEEYKQMTREEKRTIWRSVIDYIVVDLDKNIEVHFLT